MKKILLFFAIMMMAIPASAWDMVFNAKDTWTEDKSTKSISCTKDGVTLTIAGSQFQVSNIGTNYIDLGPEGTATITVNAGTATVTGITVANSRNENLDLTGAGPWTCPIDAGGLKKDDTSMPVGQPNSFTVHIGAAHNHNYADAWSKDETNHWHACTGEGECDAPKADEAAHSYGEVATETAYYTCSVCQHENATRKAEYEAATLNIALNSSGYATFSCKSNVNISGAEAYKASVDGETITLTPLTGYIPAGNGVILYSETPSTTVTMSVATSGDAAADVSGNALKATTKADGSLATWEANSWALGDGQEFLHFTGSSYIPNRAYLVHEKPAGAKAMRMVFAEGETTGIDATMIETATREGKFLDGSKIVIIKNGTKYNVAGQVIK